MKNREQGKSELTGKENPRLFFALWPDTSVCEALLRLARQQQLVCGGRIMRAETLHLTLLFLGETPVARLQELRSAAGRVHVPGFELVLERFAGWRHNGIAYAAPALVPEELVALVAQLRAASVDAGCRFDRRAFAPHVTLLRKADKMPRVASIEPLSWRADAFVLVQSVSNEGGAGYEVLGYWPLV